MGGIGGRGGRRLLLAMTVFLLANAAGGQSTCKNHTHKYASGGCHNKSFTVRRCAAAGENLADYFTANKLDESMTPDKCKSLWLGACSTFYVARTRPAVAVAQSIKCNKAMCDQSPYYSNCVTDTDCASIPNMNSGPPSAGFAWPHSGAAENVLPQYRPCCEFWSDYCNGPSCLGQDSVVTAVPSEDPALQNLCPLMVAQQHGFCTFWLDKPGGCWLAGGASSLGASTALASLLSLAVVALLQ